MTHHAQVEHFTRYGYDSDDSDDEDDETYGQKQLEKDNGLVLESVPKVL